MKVNQDLTGGVSADLKQREAEAVPDKGPPVKMKFDQVLPLLGEFGKYQKRIYLLVCFPTICTSMHKLAWVFLGPKTDYRCLLPVENSTVAAFDDPAPGGFWKNMTFPPNDTCSRLDVDFNDAAYFASGIPSDKTVSCDGNYLYDTSTFASSAVMEFNLVCDQVGLRDTAQALFMVGVLIGSIIFGMLSDWMGRRPTFFLALVIQVLFGMLAAFAPNYIIFVIARLIVGTSTSGIFLVGFVISMEMVGPSKRVIAGVVCQYFFTAGYLVTGTMAYLIHDWRMLQLALSIPGVVFLSYWWFLPESIRWLLSQGRQKEATAILRKAAAENKANIPEELYDGLCEESNSKEYAVSLRHIFKYPKLTLRAFNIFFSWFVNSGVYYGLSLNTSSLGGNPYFNFLLSGAVEVPAYAFLLISLNRFGRKYVLCGCMLAGGLAMAACSAVPAEGYHWLLITLSMFGKLCITASYGVIYISSAENFPTVVRNAGMGASSMFARVGGILASYVGVLSDFWAPLPLLVFGVLSLVGGGLALFIPETLNRRLPETLEDGEKFGTKEEKYDQPEVDMDDTMKL